MAYCGVSEIWLWLAQVEPECLEIPNHVTQHKEESHKTRCRHDCLLADGGPVKRNCSDHLILSKPREFILIFSIFQEMKMSTKSIRYKAYCESNFLLISAGIGIPFRKR